MESPFLTLIWGLRRCTSGFRSPPVTRSMNEQALPLKQFGKLLATYASSGMRIEFVPEDEVHRRPVLEVREPTPEE
jgi:hypothetical protein